MIEIDGSQLNYPQIGGHIIENYLITGHTVMDGGLPPKLNFSRSTFSGSVTINPGVKFELICVDTVFSEGVVITVDNSDIVLNFRGATFKKGLLIQGKQAIYLDLANGKVSGTIMLSELKLIASADFSNLNFQSFTKDDRFLFKNNDVTHVNFANSVLVNAVFNKTRFNENTSFDRARLLYSDLPGTGNFWDVIFQKDVYFNNTEIHKGAFFNGAQFYESVLFVSMNKNIISDGDFSAAIFHKRGYFDNSRFKNIVFYNCTFGDIVSFRDFIVDDLQISNANFLKGANFLNAEIRNADRETYRIIKSEFLKLDNHVEALKYRAKEMQAYEKEVTFKKIPSEYILLQLNKISNSHGLNWLKGIKFTIVVSIFSYIIYLFTLGQLPFKWGFTTFSSFIEASENVLEYFLRFFIITHDLDFMNNFKPNAVSYFVDIVGKVFIGYGLYQTVQAFRKYGKV